MNDKGVIYDMFKELDDSTLRQWHEFADSPLCAFIITRHEKLIRGVMRSIMESDSKTLEDLRFAQGQVKGLSEFSSFVEKVRNERRKRIDRASPVGADREPKQ